MDMVVVALEQDPQVQSQFTFKDLKHLDEYPEIKLFAILDKNHIVLDGVLNYTLKEAEEQNPGTIVVQMYLENSPVSVGEKMKEVDKWLDLQSSMTTR